MKTFYEMLMLMEDDPVQAQDQGVEQPPQGEEGLGDQGAAPAPTENMPQQGDGKPKNYMFFSNLKSIKEKVEAMLAMDASQVDAMLEDGHDWASDHISTSRDDVEEVYNWLAGEMQGGSAVPRGMPQPQPQPQEPPADAELEAPEGE